MKNGIKKLSKMALKMSCFWKLIVYTCTRTHDLWRCRKKSHTLPTALHFLMNYTLHLYGFELNMHLLSVLAGFELRISAQLFKLDSPFASLESKVCKSHFLLKLLFIYGCLACLGWGQDHWHHKVLYSLTI